MQPFAARFNPALAEFLLSYVEVRTVADPDAALTTFLQRTCVAAADLADWKRSALERVEAPVGHPPNDV